MNISEICNELFSLALHFNMMLMSLDSMESSLVRLEKACMYIVMIIWISNSTFTGWVFIIKIVEFFRSKLKKTKVQPEEKKEKEPHTSIVDLD